MGFPENDAFKKILRHNLITNCPITIDDFERALTIFGTSEPLLKGRMTAPSQTSYNITTIDVPTTIKKYERKGKTICRFILC